MTTITMKELNEKITSKYYDGPELLKTKLLKENAIIDEDKSVKWNREEVVRRNKGIKKEIQDNKNARNAANEQFNQDIISVYAKEYDMKQSQVSLIYSYVLQQSCSHDVQEILDTLEDLLSLIDQVNEK